MGKTRHTSHYAEPHFLHKLSGLEGPVQPQKKYHLFLLLILKLRSGISPIYLYI